MFAVRAKMDIENLTTFLMGHILGFERVLDGLKTFATYMNIYTNTCII